MTQASAKLGSSQIEVGSFEDVLQVSPSHGLMRTVSALRPSFLLVRGSARVRAGVTHETQLYLQLKIRLNCRRIAAFWFRGEILSKSA